MRRNSGCRGDGLTARAAAAGAAAGVWAAGDSAATAADAAAAAAAAAAWAGSWGRGCWRGSQSDTSTCVPRINRELVCGKKETNCVLNYARARRTDSTPPRTDSRLDPIRRRSNRSDRLEPVRRRPETITDRIGSSPHDSIRPGRNDSGRYEPVRRKCNPKACGENEGYSRLG